MLYRRIVFNTIQATHQQDQILRELIEAGEHAETDKIVAMDVEYGGGRTVPRVAIVSFDEEPLYYSDFCMRYEDWVETKLTEANDNIPDDGPVINYCEKEPKRDDSTLDGQVAEIERKATNPEFAGDFEEGEDGSDGD